MSYSPEDWLRHFMYEDIARTLAPLLPSVPTNGPLGPLVVDFGSKWYGDPDGGWQTHLRGMLKKLLGGQAAFTHHLATYPEVDIQDMTPVFPSGGVDILVADQVLEHVERPWKAAKEIARVVKPGGLCVVATPGLYPVHPSPLDCWRILHDGYRVLFPRELWHERRLHAWGTEARVAHEYMTNGAFPYGPPHRTVERAQELHREYAHMTGDSGRSYADLYAYTDAYDGRCPLQLWFVGQRTESRNLDAVG